MKISPPPPYSHQIAMAEFAAKTSRVLNTSDPGTGKTRGTLEGFRLRREQGDACRMLVVAPLSILKPSWGNDILEFTDFTYAIAHGSPEKRAEAFQSDADIVLINHDGVNWFMQKKRKGYELDPKKQKLLDNFTDLVIDEVTAFKHRTSQRSKSMKMVSLGFDHITALSGSLIPNTVLDAWHPAYILDHGARLGSRFFHFRSQVCHPEQQGPLPEHVKWVDKPGAADIVAEALSDITIRFKFEDCLDIPANSLRYIHVDMPKQVMDAYHVMEKEAKLLTDSGQVSAVNAASRATKMLQILSGAVYSGEDVLKVHNQRYELTMQLVSERQHSVVAFNWKHERDALCNLAEQMGISFAVIDGSVNNNERANIVENYQQGYYQVLFCHPQSAAHGLTLTKGRTTIWPSPTYNAEHFVQFNRRIYRAGQTGATETICIAANNTREVEVYEKLNGKLGRMTDLLEIFAGITKEAA
jgi:hypothetical protein